MRCALCGGPAVWLKPARCKAHFLQYFEKKVLRTIRRHGLFSRQDRVAVAASGGKDSMALLHLLHAHGFNVTAVAVDEGIAGYRDRTLAHLRKHCEARGVELRTLSFAGLTGGRLDSLVALPGTRPCAVCGTLRRHLVARLAEGFSVVATGHNMDDEAQAALMNLLKANLGHLARQGPLSPGRRGLPRRAKPFYFCAEKEVFVYALLRGVAPEFEECPHVHASFRLEVRRHIAELEAAYPGMRRRLLAWALGLPRRRGARAFGKGDAAPGACRLCGEPASAGVCAACRLAQRFKDALAAPAGHADGPLHRPA